MVKLLNAIIIAVLGQVLASADSQSNNSILAADAGFDGKSSDTKDNISARLRLHRRLMANYSRDVHPSLDYRTPIVVHLGMAVIHVDLDEITSVMSVDSWMRMSWNDPNLRWNESAYDGLPKMHFRSDEIWKPDILLYNSADGANVNHYGDTNCLVESNGDVLWVPPGHFKAYCRLSLRAWPFDTQECKLKFGSWTYNGHEIDLDLYRNTTTVEELNFYTDNREWDIVGDIGAKKNTRLYACCPETYPDVTFTFKLSRNSPAYRAIIILPCLVIMLMTGCSFLLTPSSGEKVIINSLALLASILYLIYFAFRLPFPRDEMPIIVSFFSNITALIGIAIMLNVVCMSMARERKYTSPPKFLRNLFSGCLGKLLCLGHYSHLVSSTHQRLTLELTDMAESEQQASSGDHAVSDEDQEGQNSRGGEVLRSENVAHGENSYIMRDWVLVAAGLERLFFSIYALSFAIITSVYV